MTSSDQEESETATRYVEKNGRGFKLKCSDPYGHWKIYHAANNIPVKGLPGAYTSLTEAQRALQALPEEQLPPRKEYKVVLTPKIKKEVEED